jgi:hypothetical protein
MKRILTCAAVLVAAAAFAFAEAGGVRPSDGAHTSSTGANVNVQNNGQSTDQSDPPGSEPATTGVFTAGPGGGQYYREVDKDGNFVCWRQYFERTPPATGYRWNRYNSPTGSNPPPPGATPDSTGTMN